MLNLLKLLLISVVLESPSRDSDLKSYAKVRRYFRSCMAENQDSARLASGRNLKSCGCQFLVFLIFFYLFKLGALCKNWAL